MARVSNETLAQMIKGVDEKADGINKRLDQLNNRSFKNSTDIARIKGASGVIAGVVSVIITIIGFCISAWAGLRQCG